MKNITAWMVKDVITIEGSKSVNDACILMQNNNIGSIVVLNDKQIAGIFTERDLLTKVIGKGKDHLTTAVSDVMTKDIKVGSISSNFKDVFDLMMTNNIRHLPIVDSGSLVGIVSIRDLLRFDVKLMEQTIADLTKELVFTKSLVEKSNDERNNELFREKQRLEQLVIIDSLTGLFNYRYFEEIFAKEVARAKRYNHCVTLLFIDIDYFKHYNDLNGHEQGNVVLKQLGEVLRTTSRHADTVFKMSGIDIVARYGGEEFVIILPETNKKGGFARAKRVLDDVRNFPFQNRESQPNGKLTVSIGISEYPSDASDWEFLIKKADDALYKAKNNGRDQIALVE